MERATVADRIWFEQHPGETERTRPMVDGEFSPMIDVPPEAQWVLVTQIEPGVRAREPIVVTSSLETAVGWIEEGKEVFPVPPQDQEAAE